MENILYPFFMNTLPGHFLVIKFVDYKLCIYVHKFVLFFVNYKLCIYVELTQVFQFQFTEIFLYTIKFDLNPIKRTEKKNNYWKIFSINLLWSFSIFSLTFYSLYNGWKISPISLNFSFFVNYKLCMFNWTWWHRGISIF